MKHFKLCIVLISLLAGGVHATSQSQTPGSIKGKVRVEDGSPSGVTVTLKQGSREVGSVLTNRKGEFNFPTVQPGSYDLTFRKAGLAVGSLDNIQVNPGKVNDVSGGLKMRVDAGSLAFLRGSVFNPDGRSVPGVRVDVARVNGDGSLKKLDTRVSSEETGQFAFRVPPAVAKYRVTARPDGSDPVSQDIQVDGPAVYRVSLTVMNSKH
jgi:hypothetical protein